MAANDIQAQLQSLSIPKEKRPPVGRARSRSAFRPGWLIAILLMSGLAATAYIYRGSLASVVAQWKSPEKENSVRFIQVMVGDSAALPAVLTATGKIVSDHRVVVATKVSGQIVELFFEQGDKVEQGQLLARVEDVLYRARRDEAAARLQRSLAHLEFQRINFKRVAGLMEISSAPDIEYADAKRWLEDAEAAVAADRAALASAEKSFKDTQVGAPIAGVVLTRNVEVGDFVAAEGGLGAQANAAFATIADMTKLRVEVDISELDITRIHKDMPCQIVPDAYKDRQYSGYVLWLDPGANYSKATVQVKVRIENPDEYLRVEGSAQVTFLPEATPATAHSQPTIWIPSSALLAGDSDDSGAVFVRNDGRVQKTPVRIGRRVGDRVEITGGLTPGQSIAADKVDQLSDDQRIPS